MGLFNSFFSREEPCRDTRRVCLDCKPHNPICIGEVRGQQVAKNALLLAIMGRHNILFIGPPGEGKSMLVGTATGFLPPMSNDDKLEMKEIYLAYNATLPCERPFRSIGPTITESTLIGGGQKVTPGEVSLAHTGILFMDELPQYSRKLIDKLRNPLESKEVTITRARESCTYPCNFQLIAAMNPCPCGMYGYGKCKCSPHIVRQYQAHISGPIADRIDIVVDMDKESVDTKFSKRIIKQSRSFKNRVHRVYRTQMDRQALFNADIPGHELFNEQSQMFRFTTDSLSHIKKTMEDLCLSTRKAIRLARVARTVADLRGCNEITAKCVNLAIPYVTSNIEALK